MQRLSGVAGETSTFVDTFDDIQQDFDEAFISTMCYLEKMSCHKLGKRVQTVT